MPVPYNIEKKKPIPKKLILIGLLGGLVLGFFLSLLTRLFLLEPIQIETVSMEPTLKKNNSYFIHKYYKNYKIGDIVVCRLDSGHLVSRIIGKPGDEIAIVNKALIRNRDIIPDTTYHIVYKDTRSPLLMELTPRDNMEPIRVPEGHFFLLGDNRDEAMDSRILGPLPKSCFLGVILE